MKRTWRAILALTLVCAVALTAAAMALGSKALPLTMTDACTIGDPAAAEACIWPAASGMEQNRLQEHGLRPRRRHHRRILPAGVQRPERAVDL